MGDDEGVQRYQARLVAKRLAVEAARESPPLQRQVNQAFHDMRVLEARLSKAVTAYESAEKVMLEQRER
eukprot:2649913-Pyramimonas_sp.AAC.1